MADSDTIPSREGFVFYFTFYDAIKTLPIRLRLKALEILIEYARTGVVPEEMPSRIEQFFIMAKPQIDANAEMDLKVKIMVIKELIMEKRVAGHPKNKPKL